MSETPDPIKETFASALQKVQDGRHKSLAPDPIEEIIARATYPNAWSEWGYQLPIQEARRTEAISAARHAIAALKGAGYVVVPLEPTETILTRAGFLFPGSPSYEEGSQDYRDLVKAASNAEV